MKRETLIDVLFFSIGALALFLTGFFHGAVLVMWLLVWSSDFGILFGIFVVLALAATSIVLYNAFSCKKNTAIYIIVMLASLFAGVALYYILCECAYDFVETIEDGFNFCFGWFFDLLG